MRLPAPLKLPHCPDMHPELWNVTPLFVPVCPPPLESAVFPSSFHQAISPVFNEVGVVVLPPLQMPLPEHVCPEGQLITELSSVHPSPLVSLHVLYCVLL